MGASFSTQYPHPLYSEESLQPLSNGGKIPDTILKFRDSSYPEATRAASNLEDGVEVPLLYGSRAFFLSNYRARYEKLSGTVLKFHDGDSPIADCSQP